VRGPVEDLTPKKSGKSRNGNSKGKERDESINKQNKGEGQMVREKVVRVD